MENLHHEISNLAAKLGENPLLVQGAGGNLSWKQGGTLWIKGSGTWLANANKDNIFVPVNLLMLNEALTENNFDTKPRLIGKYLLHPSIETTLHALMPQKIVAHLHCIEALIFLVDKDSQKIISQLFNESPDEAIHVAFVDYHKPGPKLAEATKEVIEKNPKTNVVFLKNHGIVVGANSTTEIFTILQKISSKIQQEGKKNEQFFHSELPTVPSAFQTEYTAFQDIAVQALALDSSLFKRLKSDWVLYPDHAVFLGATAFTYDSWEQFSIRHKDRVDMPELIFIENVGVYIKSEFNISKRAQLRCYYDVISRVNSNANLSPLNSQQVNELLDWDAEKHRQAISL